MSKIGTCANLSLTREKPEITAVVMSYCVILLVVVGCLLKINFSLFIKGTTGNYVTTCCCIFAVGTKIAIVRTAVNHRTVMVG